MLTFPKQQRLLKRKEFTKILKQGLKVVHPNMVVLALPNDQDLSRVGLIVSRKVGNAIVRNRAKRRLRESYRTLSNKPAGLDIVVIARFSIGRASQQQVDQALSQCLSRLRRKMQTRAATC
jgi:ribonuclease P protein component